MSVRIDTAIDDNVDGFTVDVDPGPTIQSTTRWRPVGDEDDKGSFTMLILHTDRKYMLKGLQLDISCEW